MNIIAGYLRSSIPLIVSISGMYLFTVRRERCQMKFNICIVVAFAFEFLIYYFMPTEDAVASGVPISKILTLLMISLLIFWGGLYVYGGWSRIGIYLFVSDLIIGTAERIYWGAWEYLTHRSAERSIIYYKGNEAAEWSSLPLYLCLLVLFLFVAYKLRNQPLRPEWLIKTIVIIYLVLGASPLVTRPGFEEEFGVSSFLNVLVIMLVWTALLFLVFVSMSITAARDNRRILYLRKLAVTEQSRLLMMQREKVRRLRHDVRKHISNLEYVLEKEPDLRSDPSILRYQEILNTNEEWMKGVFYCDSFAINLCFEQMKRYCDDKGIALDIALKRLNFALWTQEDQLMFGTLLLNLLELFGDSRPVTAVHFSGDNLMGQNILRITMEGGTGGGQGQCEGQGQSNKQNHSGSQNQCAGQNHGGGENHGDDENQCNGQSQDDRKNTDMLNDKTKARKLKERKLISNLEKDIQLVLSKYEGRIDHIDESSHSGYVINWKDMK